MKDKSHSNLSGSEERMDESKIISAAAPTTTVLINKVH